MEADWYSVNVDSNLLALISSFLSKTQITSNNTLVSFKNTMTDKDILKYVPFERYAYNNTLGLKGEISNNEQIKQFKKQLQVKNTPPITKDYWYNYLCDGPNIYGVANCMLFLSGERTLTFFYLFITPAKRNSDFGKFLFYSVLSNIRNQSVIGKIKLQILPNNSSAIKLVNSLGFKKV